MLNLNWILLLNISILYGFVFSIQNIYSLAQWPPKNKSAPGARILVSK